MFAFARFMNSVTGRWTRVVGGLAMVVGGFGLVGGPIGAVIAVAGVVPLLAGGLDLCLLAPVIHTPFAGRQVRDILGLRDAAPTRSR